MSQRVTVERRLGRSGQPDRSRSAYTRRNPT